MFLTYDAWSANSNDAVIDELFGGPQRRRYRCVQVPVNLQLFHVDIRHDTDEVEGWFRTVLTNFNDVVELIGHAPNAAIRVSLQTPVSDYSPYTLFQIKEVRSLTERGGQTGFLFVAADGSAFPDSYWDEERATDKVEEDFWVFADN